MTDVLDKPTTSPISTRKHGDILIVTSNNPPVNALGHAVRQGLVAAIEEAEADEAVNAVVIACEGQTFFAGADITEFGKPMQLPMLPTVVDIIENCTKPVVAAIHGTALGGPHPGGVAEPAQQGQAERDDQRRHAEPESHHRAGDADGSGRPGAGPDRGGRVR